MANGYSTKGLTGKSTRKQVPHKSTAMQLGITPVALLTDIGSQLNDETKSGKQVGACILSSTNVVHIATGSQPGDVWHTMTTGTAVTPA